MSHYRRPSSPAILAPGATSYHRVVFPGSNHSPNDYRPDDHAVAPETRAELVGGEVLQASPALAPHGDSHSQLDYLLRANVAPGYVSSSDLLTRTSEGWDFATDACIRRAGKHPETGHRYLEELAFEVKHKQSLTALTARARELCAHGVRRVFALCVAGQDEAAQVGPVLEWLPADQRWNPLGPDQRIEDPCLVQPLPVRALIDALEADNQVARALLEKANPVLAEHMDTVRAEGEARGEARGRQQGLAEGEARGEARGRQQGLAEGREQEAVAQLRQSIGVLCRVLNIPVTPARHAALATMARGQLVAVIEHIEAHGAWPPAAA